MALTASTNYSVDRDTLIKASLRLIGVGSIDEDPTPTEITQAVVALNIMIKAWQTDGLQLWQIRTKSMTPIEGQYQYNLGITSPSGDVVGSRPMRIIDIYRRITATVTDTPLIKMSREEYWRLSDKDSKGTPVNYYYDLQLTNGMLNIWPAPDAPFATDNTLEILYQKPFDDMDVLATDSFEFPSEWYEAIKYGLAVRLAPEYGIPRLERQLLHQEATIVKDTVMDWDTEDSSIYLAPDRNHANH